MRDTQGRYAHRDERGLWAVYEVLPYCLTPAVVSIIVGRAPTLGHKEVQIARLGSKEFPSMGWDICKGM